MSRLLFVEPYLTHFRRRYFGFIGTVILTCLIMGLGYHYTLEGDPDYRLRFVAVLLLTSTMMFILLVMEILASLSIQRFEIYDDRIAVPSPRGFSLLSLLRPKCRTIMKKDVKYAELDYQEQAGLFQTQIDYEPNYGEKGEWRCIFHFKNGETYLLASNEVRPGGLFTFFLPMSLQYPSNRCVPALKEFVRGLEEGSSSDD